MAVREGPGLESGPPALMRMQGKRLPCPLAQDWLPKQPLGVTKGLHLGSRFLTATNVTCARPCKRHNSFGIT
eukprot:959785-Amphidinium_carterae.1